MSEDILRLVDTHCHIDLFPDMAALVQEVDRHKVATIAVTNAPSVFRGSRKRARSKYIQTAVGLHPELVHQRACELDTLIRMLSETRFVGEIGLDFVTADGTEREAQTRVFERIVNECAAYGDKVLTVHSRRAAEEVIGIIGESFPGTAIFHWYSGSLTLLSRALRNGHYMSVNPAMIASEAGRKVVQAIPKERLLTESDGPFVCIAGSPARPIDVKQVVSYVANIWNDSEANVAEQIYLNFKNAIKKPTSI